MLLTELFLKEAIHQTLAVKAHDATKEAFAEFIRNSHEEMSRYLGVLKYEREYKAFGDDYGDERYKVRDRIFDNFHIWKLADLSNDNPFRAELQSELKHILELTLQDVAREYIEEKYGQIEPITREIHNSEPSPFYTRNLNWLQHIIVELDVTGVDDYREDQSREGGGYFQRRPSREKFQSRYARGDIDWNNDLGVGIKIYTDSNKLWRAFLEGYSEWFHEFYFGEAEVQYTVEDYLRSILPTYVHEVVHLEQNALAERKLQISRLGNPSSPYPNALDTGTTMIPNPSKKRARASNYDSFSRITNKYRAGKRGGYDRLSPLPKPDDPDYEDRWADYLGAQNEIDAHAAGFAALLLLEWLREHRSRSFYNNGEQRKREMNRVVDGFVNEIKNGWVPAYQSFQLYRRFIAGRIGEKRVFQKVWNRFLKRLVHHLLSHKTDLPSDPWDEPSRPNLP